MTTRIDHTGHGHDATPVARAACRKALDERRTKAVEFVARVQGGLMEKYIGRTAVRLGAYTADEVFGYYAYDSEGVWRIMGGSDLSLVDLTDAIYRVCPEFNWDMFCRMWS